jgi:signal transduction histidine kinase
MVSHELRGPLNAVLGWTRLLRTERFGEAARDRALETIERNAVAQTALIENLLDISRIVTGRMPAHRESIEFVSITENAIQDVLPSANAKQIRIEREFQAGGTITGDASQLHQAIANVLANAVKFTPSGGTITGSLTRSDEYATVSVRDTGEGIKPEFLPHIFEPFRQQDSSSTRVHGGLGLGLTIARHLIALHGGVMRAESPGVGHGATFTLSLPRTTAPSERLAPPW